MEHWWCTLICKTDGPTEDLSPLHHALPLFTGTFWKQFIQLSKSISIFSKPNLTKPQGLLSKVTGERSNHTLKEKKELKPKSSPTKLQTLVCSSLSLSLHCSFSFSFWLSWNWELNLKLEELYQVRWVALRSNQLLMILKTTTLLTKVNEEINTLCEILYSSRDRKSVV